MAFIRCSVNRKVRDFRATHGRLSQNWTNAGAENAAKSSWTGEIIESKLANKPETLCR
jgi:hypothetical protein